ncbi:hypothetical protein McpSp1_11520 [Methanocorpusculaceae archaeon Sp1]|nr:hypothetical protein [Methanocorpusculaceae archaeon Sp1]
MLRFNRLVCENFMPYLLEELSFPEGTGIVIVNGQNGHGKSSLLEALRFVLLGEIQSGKGPNGLFKAINTEGFAKGNHACKVTLDVDYLNNNYKIIRLYSPKKGKLNPRSGSDYDSPKVQVIHEGGRVLSEDEQTKLLAKIMSKNVARFYLFDGELLDEYNRILSGEKTSESSSIKKSIEDILGLPILTNTRDHLQILLNEWGTTIAKIGSKNINTQQYAATATQQKNDMETARKEADKAKVKIQETEEEIKQINDILDSSREDIQNTERKISCQLQLDGYQNQLQEYQDDRAVELKKAWLPMLYPILSEKQNSLSNEHQKYIAYQAKIDERNTLIDKIEKSLDAGKCTQCNQILGIQAIDELKQRLSECNIEEKPGWNEEDIQEMTNTLSKDLECIRDYMEQYNPDIEPSLKRLDSRISDCLQQIDNKNVELQNINKLLEASDLTQDKLKKLRTSLSKAHDIKAIWEGEQKTNLKKAEIAEENWKKAMDKLAECGSKSDELNIAIEKQKKIQKIFNLFEKGIDDYRNKKREGVEQVASDIYRQMSSLGYVGGLHITEDYGVVPYDLSGEKLPPPSSGYAHLEAFALIGGLHKNVPIKGPLFLDTPAGRLDKSNTRNLIQCIPQLSEQVILFIHDKEFDSEELHYYLSESILSEYTIEKISGTESRIKKVER